MRILNRNVYVGPSQYAKFPVIRLELDLGALEQWPTARLGHGFVDALVAALPGLSEHGCSYREPGGFIRRMPMGYDTVMGERGETLSGGQRQRIAIARALLRDAPIQILDEPLTGLDRTTAEEQVRTLKIVTRGRTTLLIAHDPISLQLADRVVHLKNRKFLEDGFPPLTLERKA